MYVHTKWQVDQLLKAWSITGIFFVFYSVQSIQLLKHFIKLPSLIILLVAHFGHESKYLMYTCM